MSLTSIFSIGLAVLLFTLYRVLRIGIRPRGLPPGPRTLPLLGNLHVFPRQHAYLQINSWARQYGPIYSLMIANQPVIVISSSRIAHALLDTRSASTSDRPPTYMSDLITNGKNLIFMRYNSEWRLARSMLHRMLTKEAIARYRPIQQAEGVQLMFDLLVDQERFSDHVARYSYSVASAVLSGIRAPRSTSPSLVTLAANTRKWSYIMEPGVHPPVDLLPALKYVPERWAKWKTLCKEIYAELFDLYEGMIVACERRIAQNAHNGSLLERMLGDNKMGANRALIRGTLGAFMEGAADTTRIFMRSLILMLVAFPEVQVKAQEQIDAVVGPDRVPLLDDYEQLPYVQAIVKEVLRIRPPAPFGVPHYTTQDEFIDGYMIPKNSIVMVNQYGILRDPDAYDDPHTFNPDRFLQSEFGTRPGASTEGRSNDTHFGSGRRICVGMHLANVSMVLNTMNLLWAFNFRNAVDPITKITIPVDFNNYSAGFTVEPNAFKCDIHVRSEQHARIIRQELSQSRSVFEAFEYELPKEDADFIRSNFVM